MNRPVGHVDVSPAARFPSLEPASDAAAFYHPLKSEQATGMKVNDRHAMYTGKSGLSDEAFRVISQRPSGVSMTAL